MIKKVAIVGPESTGKSTLCSRLAEYYGTSWVPEYARQYLQEHNNTYTYDSLLDIAKGQLALEDKYLSSLQLQTSNLQPLFIDTEMNVMKVWSEFVFGKCHQWIIDRIVEREYDLFLLCYTDLPWEPDPLREYPDPGPREQLFHIYKDILINQSVPWAIIKGSHEQRLRSAINEVNKIL